MKIASSIVDNFESFKIFTKKQKSFSRFFLSQKRVKFFLKLLKKVIFKFLKSDCEKRGNESIHEKMMVLTRGRPGLG